MTEVKSIIFLPVFAEMHIALMTFVNQTSMFLIKRHKGLTNV